MAQSESRGGCPEIAGNNLRNERRPTVGRALARHSSGAGQQGTTMLRRWIVPPEPRWIVFQSQEASEFPLRLS